MDFPIDDCHVYTYQNLDKDYDVTDFESKIAISRILAKIRQIILIIGLIWNYFALFIRKAIVLRINIQTLDIDQKSVTNFF